MNRETADENRLERYNGRNRWRTFTKWDCFQLPAGAAGNLQFY